MAKVFDLGLIDLPGSVDVGPPGQAFALRTLVYQLWYDWFLRPYVVPNDAVDFEVFYSFRQLPPVKRRLKVTDADRHWWYVTSALVFPKPQQPAFLVARYHIQSAPANDLASQAHLDFFFDHYDFEAFGVFLTTGRVVAVAKPSCLVR